MTTDNETGKTPEFNPELRFVERTTADIVDLLTSYEDQLKTTPDRSQVVPIVHNLPTFSPDSVDENSGAQSDEELYRQIVDKLSQSPELRDAGIPVETMEAVVINEGKDRRIVTKFGDTAALMEIIYTDEHGTPTEFKPQLLVPGAEAEKMLSRLMQSTS